jgi:O-6-methylguanine DNA methyltransferase
MECYKRKRELLIMACEGSMETISYSSFDSGLLKRVFVASSEKGVCAVDFLTSEKAFLNELRREFPGRIVRDDKKNSDACNQIRKYLKGDLTRFTCRLDIRGTDFQQKVWSQLSRIPYGRTCSYKEIAVAIDRPKACRAVGNANGANALPLLIPCHRVIETSGGLGGFGHGLEAKRALLDFEKACIQGKRSRGCGGAGSSKGSKI